MFVVRHNTQLICSHRHAPFRFNSLFAFVRTVVRTLPDESDVPPFTAEDVVRTKEAVTKFIVAVVAGLKPVLQLEIQLFESPRVDMLYG